jgi:hypothetical protein
MLDHLALILRAIRQPASFDCLLSVVLFVVFCPKLVMMLALNRQNKNPDRKVRPFHFAVEMVEHREFFFPDEFVH